MAELLRLYWEFFKTGLFSIGGGMATFPFLKEMGHSTGWFTDLELINMLAVSESTPGPIGINMATYIGFSLKGIPGALVATLGEVTPSVIIIILVAQALKKYKSNAYVIKAFYGLRPASAGLITAAAAGIIIAVLLPEGSISDLFIPGLILGVILYVLMNYVKPLKKVHPVFYIAASALIGIIFNWS